MDAIEEHKQRVRRNIEAIGQDQGFRDQSTTWIADSLLREYTYNFTWMDRPVIHFPQDMYVIQELIWRIKPDVVVETGIAHGGSLILSASILAMLDYCEAAQAGAVITPGQSKRKVVGVDIDIRAHNRKAMEEHPLRPLITMIEGSSIEQETIDKVYAETEGAQTVLVFLDSNHTHDHVLAELKAYAPLVTKGSYCVVWDTVLEVMPERYFVIERPWGVGDNPMTAVFAYQEEAKDGTFTGRDGAPLIFDIDKAIENKLAITDGMNGFLQRR